VLELSLSPSTGGGEIPLRRLVFWG
jgi:hypothetical protein